MRSQPADPGGLAAFPSLTGPATKRVEHRLGQDAQTETRPSRGPGAPRRTGSFGRAGSRRKSSLLPNGRLPAMGRSGKLLPHPNPNLTKRQSLPLGIATQKRWSSTSSLNLGAAPMPARGILKCRSSASLGGGADDEDEDGHMDADERRAAQAQARKRSTMEFEKWKAGKREEAERVERRLDTLAEARLRQAKDGAPNSLKAAAFVLMAARKFKAGGKKKHEEWVAEKEKQEQRALEQMFAQAEREIQREDQAKSSVVARHEANVQATLNKKLEEHLRMKRHLMMASGQETSVWEADEEVDPNLNVPTEEEKWEIGVAVLDMKAKLDKIAPGGTKHSEHQRRRRSQFPRSLPPKPTRQSIVDAGL